MIMADSAGSDDQLAQTMTAEPGSGPVASAPQLGDTLGRYRIERTLGEGGMGVVHAAFDPDLERRVALKVLRKAEGDEARQRLLREARAMARLTHPNVVTVHEVGSAHGRDYVAMELVEGETLDDWLTAQPRSAREIVAAFVAAGRGLAAAHAAGLVHRDFKPRNVLRRRDGRICVTDFGLARGVEATGLEATVRVKATAPESTPSSLSGLTATGSVLGTPAYMAPEQWSGGTVGPAADQFAFCVALWEALSGERPFLGATMEALKEAIGRGPAALDASELPRRLRRAIRRGLDPDPSKRWPSMDALLSAIVRGERRPTLALAIVGGAIVVAAGLFFVLGRSADACAPPALDPSNVWSFERVLALGSTDQSSGAEAIAADFTRWREVRIRACKADTPVRAARLACLDGVLANLDANAKALAKLPGSPHAEVGALLVDPAVCEAPRPPRLVSAFSEERLAALSAMLAGTVREATLPTAEADALVAANKTDPCAAVLARLIDVDARRTTVEQKRDLEEANGAAQRCGDERLIADVAWNIARYAILLHEPDVTAKLESADAAAALVMQPDVRAAVDELRASLARLTDHFDEAITRLDAARDGYEARGRTRAKLRVQLQAESLRQTRARPEEIAAVPGHLAQWRAEAVAHFGATDPIVREIDNTIAWRQFATGDVSGGHARLVASTRPLRLEHAVRASGRVVDEHGQPVAGATVAAGPQVIADSIGFVPDPEQRVTMTRADGTFELPEVVAEGAISAQLGKLRSPALKVGEQLTLALAPTSRLEGKVDLHGEPPENVMVAARVPDREVFGFAVLAPVQRDGTFAIDGVPRGKLIVHAAVGRLGTSVLSGTPVTVAQDVVSGIALVVPSSHRVVHVLVRSTVGLSLTRAEVIVMPGKIVSTNVVELQKIVQDVQQRTAIQIEREHAPPVVLARAKRGDVYAAVPGVPEGTSSACAIGFPTDVTDPDLDQKIAAHLDKLEVRCVPIGERDEVVVVEVPPFPRFD
jgi:predicted Ser/Thr protein kinase